MVIVKQNVSGMHPSELEKTRGNTIGSKVRKKESWKKKAIENTTVIVKIVLDKHNRSELHC